MQKTPFFLRGIAWLCLAIASGSTMIFAGALLYLSPKLPPVEKIRDIQLQTPLRVYTADGKLIAEFGEKKRTPITFDQIPPQFVHAILAAEDSRFYKHHGVDPKGLTRAFIELLTTGSIKTGGSTITMQVAKNYFLSRERTFLRKFNEILLALQIERELSKNEILELYVNKIYLGNRAYGVEAAAQVYYGKSISDLDLAQLAMIAGLPKAPSTNNPLSNPENALVRRNWILSRMRDLSYISQEDYQKYSKAPLTAEHHGVQTEANAPYLAEMVRKTIISRYGLSAYTDGYKVYTTLISDHQEAANQAVQSGLIEYDRRHGYRGPIDHLDLDTTEDLQPTEASLSIARDALAKHRGYGPLVPGFVIRVDNQSALVLLQDQTATLHLESSKWARRYINVNQRGPEPDKMQDIVSVGDIIYLIRNAENQWELGQLPEAQSALVSLSPQNGAILALVGGFDYQASKFNRAIQAGRQAGSNFKPFIYAAALESGMTPATLINDAPVVFEDDHLENTWRPENSSGKFFGPTRLRQALYKSRNLVSIRILRKIGIQNALHYAQRLGFNRDKLPNNLSLALGSAALTPLEIATGYAIIANGGFRVEPWFIDRVVDSNEHEIFKATPKTVCLPCEEEQEAQELIVETGIEQPSQGSELTLLEDLTNTPVDSQQTDIPELPIAPRVMDKRVNYLLVNMLQDVIKKGTGRRAQALKRPDLAGKTGTTNDQKDAWFSGFNQRIATTVWVGFDNPETLGRREYGARAALPIWMKFMENALESIPVTPYTQPDGIITVRIDPKTGKRANTAQRNAIFELFRIENVPDYDEPEQMVTSPYETPIEEMPAEQLF